MIEPRNRNRDLDPPADMPVVGRSSVGGPGVKWLHASVYSVRMQGLAPDAWAAGLKGIRGGEKLVFLAEFSLPAINPVWEQQHVAHARHLKRF